MKNLIGVKSGTAYVFPQTYARIKVGSYNALPLEETFRFFNVMIHIKSALIEDQNHCFYDTVLEKCLCK